MDISNDYNDISAFLGYVIACKTCVRGTYGAHEGRPRDTKGIHERL